LVFVFIQQNDAMELSIAIPPFSADRGITYKWENGFEISVKIEGASWN